MLKLKTHADSFKPDNLDTPKPLASAGVDSPPLTHQNHCRSEYDDLVVLKKSADLKIMYPLEVNKPTLAP